MRKVLRYGFQASLSQHKMATIVKQKSGKRGKLKPALVNKLELNSNIIYSAVFIPHEDSIITVASDKSIRVWVQRDNGKYWPSVCHHMPDYGVCLNFNKESGKVFVGMSLGNVHEYELSDDVNTLLLKRSYVAHTKRVNCVYYTLDYQWLLSCSNDKYFQWHCTKSGKRLGGYSATASCSCLQFDPHSCYVFMGDRSGEIHVFKLGEEQSLKAITTLKGHSGSVESITWDSEKKWLYSGSVDNSIIIWDIGGQKGSALELHGHNGKVYSVTHTSPTNQLFSFGEDQNLVVWNMTTNRDETPNWSQSDMCEKCATPFFWNFKQMWDQKAVGVRQHHCRKCGRAVCQKCSDKTSVLPKLGYECQVRVCEECFAKVTDDEKVSTSSFHDMKHQARRIEIDISKGRMLSCGIDDLVKIWDIKDILSAGNK